MKKLLAILFVVLLAFSCFTVAMVSAEDAPLVQSGSDFSKWSMHTNSKHVGTPYTINGEVATISADAKKVGLNSPVFELVPGKQYEISLALRVNPNSIAWIQSIGGTEYSFYPTIGLFEVDAQYNVGDALVNNEVHASGSNDYAYSFSGAKVIRPNLVATWQVQDLPAVERPGWSFVDWTGDACFKNILPEGANKFEENFFKDVWKTVTCTFTAIADEDGETAQKVSLGLGFSVGVPQIVGMAFDVKDVVVKEVVCQHEYTKVEGKKDATCTEPGYTGDTVCEDCGEVVTKGTDIAAGHKLDKVAAVAATHEAAGNKEHYACSVCKKLFSDAEGKTEIAAADVVVEKIAHVYGEELKSDAENHWKECECGSKAEEAAHTFGEWKVTKEATETEKGAKEKECSVCGYKVEEEIPVVGAEDEEDKEQDKEEDKEEDKAEDTTSPETGDSTNVVFWFALLMVSALAVVTTVAAKKASVK